LIKVVVFDLARINSTFFSQGVKPHLFSVLMSILYLLQLMFVKGGGYVPKLGKLVQMLHLFFELAPVNHVVSLSLISLKSQFKQQLETNFYAGSGTLYG